MNISSLCNSSSPLYRRLMTDVEHEAQHVKISFYFISEKTFVLRQVTLKEEVTRLGEEGKLIAALEKGNQVYAYTSSKVAKQLPEGIKIGDKKAKVEGLNENEYNELLKVSVLALNLLEISKNSNGKKEKEDKAGKVDEVASVAKINEAMESENKDFITFLSKVTCLSEGKIQAALIKKMQQDRKEENDRRNEDNKLQDIKAANLKHDILKKEIQNNEIKKSEIKRKELNLGLQKAENTEKNMDLLLRDAEIKEQNTNIDLTQDDAERHNK